VAARACGVPLSGFGRSPSIFHSKPRRWNFRARFNARSTTGRPCSSSSQAPYCPLSASAVQHKAPRTRTTNQPPASARGAKLGKAGIPHFHWPLEVRRPISDFGFRATQLNSENGAMCALVRPLQPSVLQLQRPLGLQMSMPCLKSPSDLTLLSSPCPVLTAPAVSKSSAPKKSRKLTAPPP
jgi:hypothetical protein